MNRLGMLLVACSGCAATNLVTVAPNAHVPSALLVMPVSVDQAAPTLTERRPLIEAFARRGLSVAEERTTQQPSDAAVLTTRISSLKNTVVVPPATANPFEPNTVFEWVHYQVELRLVDSSGRELARAFGQVNDGVRERTALRQLIGTLGAQLAAGLPNQTTVLAYR